MNNLLDQQLEKIQNEKRMGLMTHVIVGYPSLKETQQLVKLMDKSKVDFIELQIPFSDPLADGPTIMRACEQALEKGIKVADSFSLAKVLSSRISTPLLFMVYYNNIFKYGVEKFIKDASFSGISGLIVPDMPLEEEEQEHFLKFCDKYKMHHIHVLSPASTDDRIKKNALFANGFVYCTARQGITGAKTELDPKIQQFLKRVSSQVDVPLAVGFGISKKEHINALKGHAQIAVVGSAILDIINAPGGNYLMKVKAFLNSLTDQARNRHFGNPGLDKQRKVGRNV